jgi:hypothetical protein
MIDLIELKKFCNMYDEVFGKYPEFEYEGQSIYEFVEQRIEAEKQNRLNLMYNNIIAE